MNKRSIDIDTSLENQTEPEKDKEKNMNNNEYDNIHLSINSGIISQIYTMIVSCVSDFGGFLLGKYKIVHRESNTNKKTLLMNIDQVIAIYDKAYINEKLEKLLSKIIMKYPTSCILSTFTAKAYSFPLMSIKDQEFYFKVNDYMIKATKSIPPLLFSTFIHTLQDKTTSFESVFYSFNKSEQMFNSVHYSINNLNNLFNTKQLNSNPNRASDSMINREVFEFQVASLRNIITNSLNEVEFSQLKTLKEIKVSIKTEVEEFNSTLEKIIQLINNKS